MKIIQKDLQKTPGSSNKHSKSSKKSKGAKKLPEKVPYNGTDFPELPKPKEKKINDEDDIQSPINDSVSVKTNLKATQLEKRKPDGIEWKTLKKIDYQRLETVLEEGQISCEETSSIHTYEESGKSDSESCSEGTNSSVGHPGQKKPWFHRIMPLNEYSNMTEGVEGLQLQASSQQTTKLYRVQSTKKQQNTEKEDKNVTEESHGEPAESKSKELNEKFAQTKRGVILNGMMEILPIFSNDKFVCSRDALSVEECEDLEPLDKNMSASGKTLFDSKSAKETESADMKPFFSGNSVIKNPNDRSMMKLRESKEVNERKFRYKVLTDKSVVQKTSSPFINSLLILTSFAEERNRLTENGTMFFNGNVVEEAGAVREEIEGQFFVLKLFYAFLVTTFGLVLVLIGVAWRFYEPPCFLDYILEFVPFTHRRRTYVQQFFDQLIKIMKNVFNGLCKNSFCSRSNFII